MVDCHSSPPGPQVLAVRRAILSIQQLILTGHSAPDSLSAALIGPVRCFILEFARRFVTDSISHACWSGLAGLGSRPAANVVGSGLAGRRRAPFEVRCPAVAIMQLACSAHPAWPPAPPRSGS